ncbi:MAG: sigma 54-interacting transcriptional regulator [Lentisphaeria bacterium]|nr:sigma 54-interacting transcriptional regulator [Lentisphaeria bacterium]
MKPSSASDFFREVTLRITGHLDPGEALFRSMEYLKEFIPLDTMGLYYLDLEQLAIRTVAEVSVDGGLREYGESLPSTPLDDVLYRYVVAKMEKEDPLDIINRPLEGDPMSRMPSAFAADLPSRSVMALRLRIEEEAFGVLLMSAAGNNRYTPEHGELITVVKEPIAITMSNARRYRELSRLKNQLRDDNLAMQQDMGSLLGSQIIGSDFGLKHVMDLVRQVAPQACPVLLLGETGTGKEVLANAIHLASSRRDGPMIRVQCGAIPEALLDGELFGHERGAFTGAIQTRRGRFERASQGTIFLDEIAELTPEAQVKLLRVLQEKEFERVGGDRTIKADVRVIAATHRDLPRMVADGTFREDLWFRLNIFPIHLPPVRERRGDIPSLVRHFVERKAREMGLLPIPEVDPNALGAALDYDWPGNVRELQNVVERALILSRGHPLRFLDLTPVPPASTVVGLGGDAPLATLNDAMASHIQKALELTKGRVEGPDGAARMLAVNPSTLRFRIKKLGIR